MNGILPVDKPADFTSFDVVAKLRGVTHTKKIGHSGTLDPMATGVLPLFFGSATKLCAVLPNEDKRYAAGIKFGVTTDTEDITGKVLTEREAAVTEQEFAAVINEFTGKQLQTPPMYSAVKVGGRPLYDLARKGKEVERPAKEIEVYSISVLKFEHGTQSAEIEVSCGKGTYIRTLIADIGERLGCGAIMTRLRRTEAGGFKIAECYTLEQIISMMEGGTLEAAILPPERLFGGLPKLFLNKRDSFLYKNGVPLELTKRGWCGNETYAVYSFENKLAGISKMDEEAGELKLIKML